MFHGPEGQDTEQTDSQGAVQGSALRPELQLPIARDRQNHRAGKNCGRISHKVDAGLAAGAHCRTKPARRADTQSIAAEGSPGQGVRPRSRQADLAEPRAGTSVHTG